MESRNSIKFILLFVFFCNCQSQMLFPINRSVLGTGCPRGGSAKLREDCPATENTSHEKLGFIRELGKIVVCCPPESPSKVKGIFTSVDESGSDLGRDSGVGSKAKAFCAKTQASTTLSPLIPKVIGGNFSDVGEFPHMAALGYVDIDGDRKFKCGGALISHRFLQTFNQ